MRCASTARAVRRGKQKWVFRTLCDADAEVVSVRAEESDLRLTGAVWPGTLVASTSRVVRAKYRLSGVNYLECRVASRRNVTRRIVVAEHSDAANREVLCLAATLDAPQRHTANGDLLRGLAQLRPQSM